MKTIDRSLIAPTLVLNEPDGHVVNYEQFVKLIDNWLDWFDENGIMTGDKAILHGANSTNLFALLFACFEAGVIFVGVETRDFYKSPKYKSINIDVIITNSRVYETVKSEATFADRVLCGPFYEFNYDRPLETKPRHKRKSTDFATLSYTSGTIDEPKAVFHTHESILTATLLSMELYEPKDRASIYMNINHLGFLTAATLPPILVGCNIIIIRGAWSIGILYMMAEHKVTKMQMFDWAWRRSLELWDMTAPWASFYLDQHPTVITGGTCASEAFVESMFKHGVGKVHILYGMTEAPPPVIIKTVTPENFAEYDSAWLGEVAPDWEVKIDNRELLVRGPSIGYDGSREKLSDSNGWLHTGDICTENDGKFQYVGRDYVFNRDGKNVSFAEIQTVLDHAFLKTNGSEPFVLLSLTIENKGYLSLVVLNEAKSYEGNEITLEMINARLQKSFSFEHMIDLLFFVKEFPTTGLKVDREALREQARKLIGENETD